MKTSNKVLAGAVLAAALTAGTAIACAPPPPAPPKAPTAQRQAPPAPPPPPAPPSTERLSAAEARLEAAVAELTAAIEARTAGIDGDVELRTEALEAVIRARVDAAQGARLRTVAYSGLSPEEVRAIREQAQAAAREGARAAEAARTMVRDLQPQIEAIKAEAAELRRACLAGEIECEVSENGERITINREGDND